MVEHLIQTERNEQPESKPRESVQQVHNWHLYYRNKSLKEAESMLLRMLKKGISKIK